MNAAAARATQRALDHALAVEPIPTAEAFESDSEYVWLMYHLAEQQMEANHGQ